MKFSGIKCDMCGAEKKVANHWFVAFVEMAPPALSFHQWNASASERAIHLWGQSCAQKKLNEFLAKWSIVTVACFLLLLVGCTRPKEQAKPTPAKVDAIHAHFSVDALELVETVAPRRFPVCHKRGETHHASNSTFRILCWSESKQVFTEPYVLLEQ